MARIPLIENINTSEASWLTNFGESTNDIIIVHVRSINDEFMSSFIVDREDWYVVSNTPDGETSATNIDLEGIMVKNGYGGGTYNIKIHCVRQQLAGVPVSAISEDKREIKIAISDVTETQHFNELYLHINGLHRSLSLDGEDDHQTYSVPLVADEGSGNDLIQIINALKTDEDNDRVLYFRLHKPFVQDAVVSVNIGVLMSDIKSLQIELRGVERSEPFRLLRPNFDLTFDQHVGETTPKKTWEEILGSGQTTSQQLISQYVSSSYGEGVELNIDYRNYNNFVHFSSAEERLRNFKYKMTLLETYRSDISELRGLSTVGEEALSNIEINKRKIDGVLSGFDGYEKYLYYGSGSFYSGSRDIKYTPSTWPKYNNTKPYCNVSSSDAVVKKWYGDTNPNGNYFGGQLTSASLYDRDNDDMLIKALPQFVLNDGANSAIHSYMHMLGHHYDILFNYVKHITSIHSREEDPNKGMPKDLLFNVAESLGLQMFNGNVNEDLWQYALGTNIDETTNQSGLGTTSGSLSSFSGKDRTQEIWNRLINNLPWLLKTKGTERGVRALINCYGIPSSILRIVEFGGPEIEGQNSQLAMTRYANALRFSGADKISHDWCKIDKNHPRGQGIFPNTMEMRIKTKYKRNQTLWADTQSSRGLVLEHSSSAHDTYWKNQSPYGRLKFWASGSQAENGYGGIISCSTDWTPIYDGDWWNIMLRRTMPTGSGAISPADQKLQPVRYDIFAKKAGDHSQGRITHHISASTRTVSGSTNKNGWIKAGTMNQTIGFRPTEWDTEIGCPEDVKTNWPAGYGFSGSMQEYRLWYTRLSEQAFDQHVQNPQCIVGNNYSSSYYDLITRFKLGTDLNTYDHSTSGIKIISSSHPSAHKYTDFSTVGGVNYGFATGSGFSTYGNDYEEIEEVYYINMPSTIGSKGTSNKIRIEKNHIHEHYTIWSGETHSHLSRTERKELSAYDTSPMDSNKLGIYLSPSNDMNIDIANNIGQTSLDRFVGDPRDDYKEGYTELNDIRKEYFQKFSAGKDLWDYIRQVEYFDGSLFKMIKSFVPKKARELTGLLIEPTILERNKIKRERPVLEEDAFKDPAVIKMHYNSTASNDTFATASYATIAGDYTLIEGNLINIRRDDHVIYVFTSSNDMDVPLGSNGSPFDSSIYGTNKTKVKNGYNIHDHGSRYPQTQLIVHQGTGGYTQGSMSFQLTPEPFRNPLDPCITGSRVSNIYMTKNYFYSSSVSASRHYKYITTNEWRGPYEYSRHEDQPLENDKGKGYIGQFNAYFGSFKHQAYSSSNIFAEVNIDEETGVNKLAFSGCQLQGPDFNQASNATPDGKAVVEFFETNPNLLYSATEPTANFGNILLSGERPPDQTSTFGGQKGDIIPGSIQPGPQGQRNGYWLNTGYEMRWIKQGPIGSIYEGPGGAGPKS